MNTHTPKSKTHSRKQNSEKHTQNSHNHTKADQRKIIGEEPSQLLEQGGVSTQRKKML